MKKLLYVIILIIAVNFHCYGQYDGDFKLSPICEYQNIDNSSYFSAGVKAEVYLSDNISINYHILFGASSQKKFYFQTTASSVGGILLFVDGLNNDSEEIKYLGLLLMIIPDGLSLHFDAGEKLRISPYFNPLLFVASNSLSSSPQMAGEYGISFNIKKYETVVVEPYIGIKKIYADIDWGMAFGLSIGYIIN